MIGSTKLNEEQQEFYVKRFGRRYLHVQQTPALPSRKKRRDALRAQQFRNDGSPKQKHVAYVQRIEAELGIAAKMLQTARRRLIRIAVSVAIATAFVTLLLVLTAENV